MERLIKFLRETKIFEIFKSSLIINSEEKESQELHLLVITDFDAG